MQEKYIVKKGEQLEDIAKKFSISVNDIIEMNDLEDYHLVEGQRINLPISGFSAFNYYTVKEGDNLYDISQKYDTSLETIVKINGLEINEYIHPGMRLLVPNLGVKVYITKAGDNLSSIRKDYNLTAEDLLLYNNHALLLPDQILFHIDNV